MKKSSSIIAALVMILCGIMLMGSPVQARGKVRVKKISCTKAGTVKASFKSRVKWGTDAAVKVTDPSGNEMSVTSIKKNKKSLVCSVSGLQEGLIYKLTISGVRSVRSKTFRTISRRFCVRSYHSNIKLKKITARKKVVSIRFKHKVVFDETVSAVITDADGNIINTSVKSVTGRTIKISTDGLQKKVKYTITINGVKRQGENEFGSVTYTFRRKR